MGEEMIIGPFSTQTDFDNYMARARNGWKNPVPEKKTPLKIPIPTEHEEQKALFLWAAMMEYHHPELRLMFAIPNGGLRDKVVAAKLCAEGVKPGVPDVFLPVARGEYHGLFIEMKRQDGGQVSDDQKWYHRNLRVQGYRVEVCAGFDESKGAVEGYLISEKKHPAKLTTSK